MGSVTQAKKGQMSEASEGAMSSALNRGINEVNVEVKVDVDAEFGP